MNEHQASRAAHQPSGVSETPTTERHDAQMQAFEAWFSKREKGGEMLPPNAWAGFKAGWAACAESPRCAASGQMLTALDEIGVEPLTPYATWSLPTAIGRLTFVRRLALDAIDAARRKP